MSSLHPLPNLTSRFGMAMSSTSKIMGQRGSTTQGLFVRHGSDEHGDPRPHSRRFSSRDRSDRQSASLPPIHRIHPGGTQERQDWLEALKDVTARVTTLESSNRNLTQTIARVEQNHGAKLEELNDDRTAYKAYICYRRFVPKSYFS